MTTYRLKRKTFANPVPAAVPAATATTTPAASSLKLPKGKIMAGAGIVGAGLLAAKGIKDANNCLTGNTEAMK